MGDVHAPRPAADLFPESLSLSPKQSEVLSTLQNFPQGARAVDVAKKLGMHVNTARGHLDELTAKQAVSVASSQAEGRGRPSLIFHAQVPDHRAIAKEYISLIELLVSLVADNSPADREQALEIGRAWAKKMGATGEEFSGDQEALTHLYGRLRDIGFDPHITHSDAPESSTDVALNSCPFIAPGGKRPSPFICAMHEGFIDAHFGRERESDAPARLTLLPFAKEKQCVVRIAPGAARNQKLLRR